MLTTKSLGRSSGYHADMSQPQIPAGGITTAYAESAKDCLTWLERPPTPPEIKKYRQSTIHEPGKILRHYGTADDPIPEGTFGSKTVLGPSTASLLKTYPDTEISRWKYEQSEKVYASTKREPLGSGYVRGHKLPEGLGTVTPFGVPYGAKEKDEARQAGTIIFPVDFKETDPDAAHRLYVKSHDAFAPGEQRHREYDWSKAGVNPETFRFGLLAQENYRDGVRKALQPATDETVARRPSVVTKVHEDFKSTATDYLGKPRMLGTGERALAPNHTFGVPSMRRFEPGVADLLRTGYTPEEQQPDANLGKSLREGFRNAPKPGDETRSFGTPTIRTDLGLPRRRGIADARNFGNEPDALQLLRPPRSAERGVSDEHYVKLRPRAEVMRLVKEAKLNLSDADFERVFSMACDADCGGAAGPGASTASFGAASRDVCCLDTFFKARHFILEQEFEMAPPF